MSDSSIFDRAAEHAAESKAFLAWDVAHFVSYHAAGRSGVYEKLGISADKLALLELCRTPRREPSYFRVDLDAIASYIDVDVAALADLVRLSDALSSFTSAPTTDASAASPALLAVARDTVVERTVVTSLPPTGSGFQPTWLSSAVAQFWAADRPNDFPWAVELEVLLRLPLALVQLDNLATDAISGWLAARDTPLHLHAAPRRLCAALVAYGGRGIVFVDAGLSDEERRVSVAHEAAHFLGDYLLPRFELEASAPDLVDVLDGLREPEADDAITALLARVPLGIHSHLLARSSDGDYVSRETENAEERATRIAWELLAPEDLVSQRIGGDANPFTVARTLQEDFGLPASTAHAYAKFLTQVFHGRDPLRDRFGIA